MDQTVPREIAVAPDFEAVRVKIRGALEPGRKAALGQFMTPSPIARFMATLFDDPGRPAALLDAGAGIGSLSIAAVARLGQSASIDAWEIDPLLRKHLEQSLELLGVEHRVHADDFITSAVRQIALASGRRYTHAILNPPYRKLNSGSVHRALLRKVGIETVNLYAAFIALAVLLMEDDGQVVAIVPRSFCNGPYYRPFRHLLLKTCSLDRIHVFESRTRAFQDDDVLQENVIIKLVRAKRQGQVVVSSSHDQRLADYRESTFSFEDIVKLTDPETFIHVPTDSPESYSPAYPFRHSLDEIGIQVCTGPVVDFRLREHWLVNPVAGSIPLLYPHHFSGGGLQFPKRHKKPNALRDSEDVKGWLMPNDCYVLVRRFSSKEEKRRIVAYVYDPASIPCERIGFENHWNVFHCQKHGIDPTVAQGLACVLNSTLLDKHFRVFSGHTQVNATDLRNMRYPSLDALRMLGRVCRDNLTQAEIDEAVRQIHEQEI